MKHLVVIVILLFTLVGGLVFTWINPRDNNSPHAVAFGTVDQTADDNDLALPQLPDRIEFRSQVQPIFAARCMKCHNKGKAEGGLRLDRKISNPSVVSGIDLIVPGQSASSELFRRVVSENEDQMPPDDRLRDDEIQILRRWIDEGAYWPGESPQVAADWSSSERSHWAFRPLKKPAIPSVEHRAWVRNPIDAFLLAKREKANLSPPELADRQELVRRWCFAITGLPPTLAQQQRVQQMDEASFNAFIDDLLASSDYGEHWASYWLDLVRYADTNGYEDDGLKAFAWKYRDFVIRSLNNDRRYDEFVRMQITGDLFEKPTMEDFVAVGFLRLGVWDSEPDDELVDRYHQLDDVVSTTSLVFLGLTVGCARCHDHPLEPIASADYYRFLANFHGLARPTKGRLEEPAPSATSDQLTQAKRAQQKQRELLRQASLGDETEAAGLRHKAATIAKSARFELAYRFLETDLSEKPTRLLLRGNPHRPGEFIPAGPLSILAEKPWELDRPGRLQLADWVTTKNQALIARVIVNRVWDWHFGRGIVATTSNLGSSGALPTHPDLLEYLANWFVHDADWSLKKLHRLILTSNTFRSRREFPSVGTKFPEIVSQRRLRAEVLYDSLLSVSGLRTKAMYGPPDYPRLPDQILESLAAPTGWENPTPIGRRAIYLVVKRNLPVPFLEAFNAPSRSQSCEARVSNQTATQALALWNSPFVEDCARAFAERIVKESDPKLDSQIDLAFQLAIARKPDDFERETFRQFLGVEHAITKQNSKEFQSLCEMCLVIFNLNEFVILN